VGAPVGRVADVVGALVLVDTGELVVGAADGGVAGVDGADAVVVTVPRLSGEAFTVLADLPRRALVSVVTRSRVVLVGAPPFLGLADVVGAGVAVVAG